MIVKLTAAGVEKYKRCCEAAVENYKNGLDVLREAILKRDMELIKDGYMETTEEELEQMFGKEEITYFERIK